jgi:Zn-dependent protease with chaperone function
MLALEAGMNDDSEARVTIQCRHCAAGNRIPVEKALADLPAVRCGRCSGRLLRVQGERLGDLRDEELAHPWDREALDKLKALPYADRVLSQVFGATIDKVARFRHLAGGVRVSEAQVPRLWSLYREAATRLDIEPPPLFVVQDPTLNAFAMGAGAPFVAVTTGLLDGLEDREVLGVLGHELTHVRLGHVLYRTLAVLLVRGALGVAERFFGVGGILLAPLRAALLRWYQMSELSADRGGLLATASVETHVRTEMVLAGGSRRLAADYDPRAFIAQAEEADRLRDSDVLLFALELLDGNQRTHPLPAWRVHHALRWAHTEAFFQILAGMESRSLPPP